MAHSQPAALYTPNNALMMLSSTLPSRLPSTLSIPLDGTIPAYVTIRSQYALKMLSSTHPDVVDDTVPACFTKLSDVYSQGCLNHTPEHALMFTPNGT